MDEKQDYIERLFVHDVDRIPILGRTKYQYDRLLLSVILRRLVVDGLAYRAGQHYGLRLLVLNPEPKSQNIPSEELRNVPDIVMKYAPDLSLNYPPGFYHRPYKLDEFLGLSAGVALHKSISARDAILFVANKLGGAHLDSNFELHPLHELNNRVSFFGNGVVYEIFDKVAEQIWRCLAPLRDLIVEKHGGSCAFPTN